jgi:hypothetical protein
MRSQGNNMAVEHLGNITEREIKIINDPSASFWLKKQITALQNRDIVDGLNDAEILVEILKEKADLMANT